MKVGFLGNMNNNAFVLVRYLRDAGIDATFLMYPNEAAHFQPAADTFSLDFRAFGRKIDWGVSTSFLATSARAVRDTVDEFDILVGCGLAPAFLEKIGRPLDVFMPYGDDIWTEVSYRLVNPRHLLPVWSAVHHQRRGIPKSKVFHMVATNALYERQWERYGGAAERWTEPLPLVHLPTYDPATRDVWTTQTHWKHVFRQIRDRNELVVFYHARHLWADKSDKLNNKGTDIFLEGWKMFRQQFPNVSATVVTFEYGRDVSHSKRLIEDLGISDSVTWLPLMSRKDIMAGLVDADIVCDELVNSWMGSGVTYEALAMGVPVLTYRDDALYASQYESLYPVLNARSAEDVAARLAEHVWSPDVSKEKGKAGRDWYEKHVVEAAVNRYLGFVRQSPAFSSN